MFFKFVVSGVHDPKSKSFCEDFKVKIAAKAKAAAVAVAKAYAKTFAKVKVIGHGHGCAKAAAEADAKALAAAALEAVESAGGAAAAARVRKNFSVFAAAVAKAFAAAASEACVTDHGAAAAYSSSFAESLSKAFSTVAVWIIAELDCDKLDPSPAVAAGAVVGSAAGTATETATDSGTESSVFSTPGQYAASGGFAVGEADALAVAKKEVCSDKYAHCCTPDAKTKRTCTCGGSGAGLFSASSGSGCRATRVSDDPVTWKDFSKNHECQC